MEKRLEWLTNPEIFQVNREAMHSDHKIYKSYEDEKKNPEGSYRQSLNGEWKFYYGKKYEEKMESFIEADKKHWDTIKVPGHVELQGYGTRQYINTMYPWDGVSDIRPPMVDMERNAVLNYARSFTLTKEQQEKEMILHFDGVEIAFYVWLNGTFIGYSEDTFTPSEFNITKALVEGENDLFVQVFQRSSASWIEDQDFWRFSGIFREVYLYALPSSHVRDIKVKALYDYEKGKGTLCFFGDLVGAKPEKIMVRLLSPEKKEIFYEVIEKKENEEIHFEKELPKVAPWSSEIPALYTLYVELYDAQELVEIAKVKTGFRTFEMKNRIMCINGKRILFKGVNRHEFSAVNGRSITKEEMLQDILFMKKNNINAVRTSHYPNQSLWYELCDEYGIYLIDETNMESHGSWQKLGEVSPEWNVPGSLPEWENVVLDRAKSMYERDKNHPSILIWSLGNESYAGENIKAMSEYFHEVDSERLVHYEGVFWNRKYDDISDMESRMYAKPKEIKEYLENNPKKPFISCEYMHAMGNSLGGMELYTKLEEEYPLYQGGYIWDYIDQAILVDDKDKKVSIPLKKEYGEKQAFLYGGDFDDRATDYCFCTDGIVFADRTPSPKVQEVKQLYANIQMKIKEKWVTIYNRNLFLSTDSYVFRAKIYKDGVEYGVKEQKIVIHPGESFTMEFPLPMPSTKGEYILQMEALAAEASNGIEKGHLISFAQEVFEIEEVEEAEKITTGEGEEFTVIKGDVNIGVRGKDFFALFSKGEGGIISYTYKEKEYILRTPKVIFHRAQTDNDKGMGSMMRYGQWQLASNASYVIQSHFHIKEEKDKVEICFGFQTGTVPSFIYEVSYEVHSNGKVLVTLRFPGVSGMSEMPLLGMEWKMKGELSKYQYYGKGPLENYIDRNEGARLGIYQGMVADNLTNYLIPQECGNRTGVRYMKVMDWDKEHGFTFRAKEEPFECSVLPYSTDELQQAMHSYELPNPHYTWVRIMAKQMGVGGDDSWGAPVHNRYLIPSNKPMILQYEIGPNE